MKWIFLLVPKVVTYAVSCSWNFLWLFFPYLTIICCLIKWPCSAFFSWLYSADFVLSSTGWNILFNDLILLKKSIILARHDYCRWKIVSVKMRNFAVCWINWEWNRLVHHHWTIRCLGDLNLAVKEMVIRFILLKSSLSRWVFCCFSFFVFGFVL